MKHYTCGSLVPGCKWQTRHSDSSEIVRRTAAHMKFAHHEHTIRPEMISRIKERIAEDKSQAA